MWRSGLITQEEQAYFSSAGKVRVMPVTPNMSCSQSVNATVGGHFDICLFDGLSTVVTFFWWEGESFL